MAEDRKGDDRQDAAETVCVAQSCEGEEGISPSNDGSSISDDIAGVSAAAEDQSQRQQQQINHRRDEKTIDRGLSRKTRSVKASFKKRAPVAPVKVTSRLRQEPPRMQAASADPTSAMPVLRGIRQNPPNSSSVVVEEVRLQEIQQVDEAKTSRQRPPRMQAVSMDPTSAMPVLRGIPKNQPNSSSVVVEEVRLQEIEQVDEANQRAPPRGAQSAEANSSAATRPPAALAEVGANEVVPAVPPADSPPEQGQDIQTRSEPGVPVQLEEGLAEATPVAENDEDAASQLENAQEIDIEQQQQDLENKKQQERNCRRIGFLIAAISISILAISLAVILSSSDDDENESSPRFGAAEEPTSIPTIAPTTTTEPTAYDAMMVLLESLPEYTVESLKDPLSPESLAYSWLEDNQYVSILLEWRVMQLFALACFYYSFNGTQHLFGINDDWLDETKHECDWYFKNLDGVFDEGGQDEEGGACNENSEYHELVVSNASTDFVLDGATIPPEVSLLTSLESLVFRGYHEGLNMSLSGMIPSELGQLTKLTRLEMSSMLLTGIIPTYLGLFQNLSSVMLSFNDLSGPIPSELALLSNLEHFEAQGNSLTGRLPTQLGSCFNMLHINVSSNDLSGAIPSEYGTMTSLTELDLGNTQLSSTIPVEVGDLAVTRGLGYLALPDGLSGTVPSKLCYLENPSCVYEKPQHLWEVACSLSFECRENLCGCDSCVCNNTDST